MSNQETLSTFYFYFVMKRIFLYKIFLYSGIMFVFYKITGEI